MIRINAIFVKRIDANELPKGIAAAAFLRDLAAREVHRRAVREWPHHARRLQGQRECERAGRGGAQRVAGGARRRTIGGLSRARFRRPRRAAPDLADPAAGRPRRHDRSHSRRKARARNRATASPAIGRRRRTASAASMRNGSSPAASRRWCCGRNLRIARNPGRPRSKPFWTGGKARPACRKPGGKARRIRPAPALVEPRSCTRAVTFTCAQSSIGLGDQRMNRGGSCNEGVGHDGFTQARRYQSVHRSGFRG